MHRYLHSSKDSRTSAHVRIGWFQVAPSSTELVALVAVPLPATCVPAQISGLPCLEILHQRYLARAEADICKPSKAPRCVSQVLVTLFCGSNVRVPTIQRLLLLRLTGND